MEPILGKTTLFGWKTITIAANGNSDEFRVMSFAPPSYTLYNDTIYKKHETPIIRHQSQTPYYNTPMLDTLISSKTRIKLLLKFFLNSSSRSYLRSLETEFDESTNAIRLELNRFEEAGMLQSEKEGNRKYFKANTKHPLFGDVQKIMQKYVGIDQIILRVVEKLGNLEQVYVEGKLAKGVETDVIDLILVGKNIDRQYLTSLINKAEEVMKKHIRYVIFESGKAEEYLKNQKVKPLLIWGKSSR